MSTTGRSTNADADALESASFVRLCTRPDGDAVAASGLLARALTAREIPFQVSVVRTIGERTSLAEGESERAATDLTISVGPADGEGERLDPSQRPIALAAAELVRELGETPDPILTLAGVAAAGISPGAGDSRPVLEQALDRGRLERRPGVAVPTADPIEGLAYSTRVYAPWSGDREATRDAFEGVGSAETDPAGFDTETRRAIGSLVAIDAVGSDQAVDSAATSVGRVLRPYGTDERIASATVGGYADLLEATARIEPGIGVALAIGHEARTPALDAWREHGRRTHEALDSASTKRYDGLFVVHLEDGDIVEPAAELTASYTAPEPLVVAIGDGRIGVARRPEPAETDARTQSSTFGPLLEAIARELGDAGVDCGYDVSRRHGYLEYDPVVDEATIIETVRGQL